MPGNKGSKRLVPIRSGAEIKIRWINARAGYLKRQSAGVQWLSCNERPNQAMKPPKEPSYTVFNPGTTFVQSLEATFTKFTDPCRK